MTAQLGLPAALHARGLSVETVPGWETRSAGSFAPLGAICHWTAGPAGATGRPSLNIVVNGRPDLSGPLCNVYLDRAGIAVVVAAGRANHAGAGNWRGLTANSQLFGTECEAAGPDDFTAAQRASYPLVNAAYCDLGRFGPEMVAGHSEYALPAGRKTDINNYPMTALRAQVAAVLNGTDMPLTQAEKDELVNRTVDGVINRVIVGKDVQLWQVLGAIYAKTYAERHDLGGRPVDGMDDLFGHVLSTEARVKALAAVPSAAVNVDPAALAAALLADEASVARLGDAIAAGLAKRVGNG